MYSQQQILEEFLSDYSIDNVCGFYVSDYKVNDKHTVILFFNITWHRESYNPLYFIYRTRLYIIDEILKFTGIDVYVSHAFSDCD